MKTRNQLSILAVVCLWLCLPLASQAQVKIGAESLPAQGAILDLNTSKNTDAYVGGLLLPNVVITDLTAIPATFTDAIDSDEKEAALAGMIVYNPTTTGDIEAGVYLWGGAKWFLISTSGSSATPVSPAQAPEAVQEEDETTNQ